MTTENTTQTTQGGAGELLPLTKDKITAGSSGPAVEVLAEALHRLGYASPQELGTPIVYGQKMKAALVAFQTDTHLTADGAYGPMTRAMLLLRLSGAPATGPAAEPARAQGITLAELRAIMPNLKEDKAAAYLEPLNAALLEGNLYTLRRQAAFLAQVAHESAEFRYFEELASGDAYEGRADLGNTQPGDGRRYKGRGPIQLTGRKNYRLAGEKLGLDLEGKPQLVAEPAVGFRVSVWFWTKSSLNLFADVDDFDTITRIINGGFNGKAHRDAYYERALKVLAGKPASTG